MDNNEIKQIPDTPAEEPTEVLAEIPAEAPVEAPEAPAEAPAQHAPIPPTVTPFVSVDNGKGLSIAAVVLGIVGILGGYVPVLNYIVVLCTAVGIVLGVQGRKKSVAALGHASGLSTTGLVLSIVGTAIAVINTLCVTAICNGLICTIMEANISY